MKEDETEEVRDVAAELVSSSMVGEISKAEIDIQITTAKRFPRSVKIFKAKALEMATLDEDTASSMFYALPRGGKTLEGPSVRLAEIVGSAWGNVRYGSRVIEVGDKFITAQGVCFDLETNTQAAVEVRRRITGRDGRRFNEDMITVTGNAAMSIALRNAIFKVVPFAYVKNIYEAAKLVAIGDNLPMSTRRTRAFDFFRKLGVADVAVLGLLGRPGIEDVSIDDLVMLTGLRTAIKDGDTTVEQVFAEVAKPTGTVVTPDSLTGAAVTATNDAKRPEETKPAEETKPEPEKEKEQTPPPAPPAEAPKASKKKQAPKPATTTDDELEEASRLFGQ